MKKNLNINIRLTPEQDMKLRKLCEGTGLDRSNYIRQVILSSYDKVFLGGGIGSPTYDDSYLSKRQERAWRKIADRLLVLELPASQPAPGKRRYTDKRTGSYSPCPG